MPDYVAYVANWLGRSTEMVQTNENERLASRMTLQLDGWEVVIDQHPDLLRGRSDLRGCFAKTTTITVVDVEEDQRQIANRATHHLCELLGFVGMSDVVQYGERHGKYWREWYPLGVTRRHRPVIPQLDGAMVRALVEQVWCRYLEIHEDRRLGLTFAYLRAGVAAGHVELDLLHLFVALECLKTSYATSEGFLRQRSTWLDSDGRRHSFQKMLEKMISDVGMEVDLRKIVELRNDIVHEGSSSMAQDAQVRILREGHQLAREYLLRLLQYRGGYLRFDTCSPDTIECPSG